MFVCTHSIYSNCALPLPLSLRQARFLAHPGKPGFAEVHNYNQSYSKGTSETCMSFSLQCSTAEQYVSPPIRTPQLSTLFSAQPHCRGGHMLCSSQQSSNMHTYRACSTHSRNQDVYSLWGLFCWQDIWSGHIPCFAYRKTCCLWWYAWYMSQTKSTLCLSLPIYLTQNGVLFDIHIVPGLLSYFHRDCYTSALVLPCKIIKHQALCSYLFKWDAWISFHETKKLFCKSFLHHPL